MKKLYEVYIEQAFKSYEKFLWFKKRLNVQNNNSETMHRIILASSSDEAITKYKNRYKFDYDYPVSCYYMISHYDNLVNTIIARETIKDFDYLKSEMRADEFLEYCRQQLYSIETLLQ